MKVKFLTWPQTQLLAYHSVRGIFIQMFTAAPAGQQHLKEVLSLTERSTLCKQKLPGINGILPKASQQNFSLTARPGVWSQVKVCICYLGAGWEGLHFVNGGQAAWPISVTEVPWLEMTFALFKFYPIWLLLLSYTNNVHNQKLSICHVAALSVIASFQNSWLMEWPSYRYPECWIPVNLQATTENVSVTYVTLVPWRRERRRHVGGGRRQGAVLGDE